MGPLGGRLLEFLKDDPDIRFFALYVEDSTDGDGLRAARRWLRELNAQGRPVVFYKAGRTEEGKKASSGHTASHRRGLSHLRGRHGARAGAVVVSSVEDFEALVKMFMFLRNKGPQGAAPGRRGRTRDMNAWPWPTTWPA